jgi:DNA polymerase-3 subunit epsilon
MTLNLTKPLVVFDIESTGLVVGRDKIIELCLIKVMPDGSEIEKLYRINPDQHIPEETTAIHGITDADVADCPTFKQLAPTLMEFIGNSDLCGYNSNKFDVPLLVEEFLRAGFDFSLHNRRIIDVQNIFHKMEPRNLKGAYKFYCNKELTNAHTANADTKATLEILKQQLERYEGVEYEEADGTITTPIINDMNQLSKFTKIGNWADLVGHIYYNKDNKECFNFGKYKGISVEEVFEREPTYYSWMMNSDFPLYTKKLITEIRTRKLLKNN